VCERERERETERQRETERERDPDWRKENERNLSAISSKVEPMIIRYYIG
jgi:hypothetical protein